VPTTTISEDQLKAQITEDYLRAEQALEDLSRTPTPDGLEERVATIAVPGSALHSEIVGSAAGWKSSRTARLQVS
jgi:hypothetical protein